jgi:hypothetical protein
MWNDWRAGCGYKGRYFSEFPYREIATRDSLVRLDLVVERRTGPLPLPTSHECTLIGRSGGGAGRCRDFLLRKF